MKARKYVTGGPVDPKDKKKAIRKGASAEYEANREKKRQESIDNANVVRRQNAINRANRQVGNPAYETSQQRASSPTYKTVGGERVGISSAERAGASQGLVGSRTPEAAKRVYKAETAKPAQEPAPSTAPAKKSEGLSEETKRAIEQGETRSRELGAKSFQGTFDESKRKGWRMKNGGMIPRRK